MIASQLWRKGVLAGIDRDNRGSFRGLGFELRTDAYGALRAANGLLISSYGTAQAEPAGDNAAGMALAGQLKTLAQSFSKAAKTHQTAQLAADIGSTKASQSSVDDKQPPLAALHTVLKGMVAEISDEEALADAHAKKTQAAKGKLPHSTDPIVAIAAKAGLGIVAGQDLQLNAGEGITLASGQDTQFAIGGASRLHTGQAIGVLAGAIKPGSQAAGKGLTLIAGKGDIDIQAQAGTLQVAAKQNLSVQSAKAHIDWASPKKISLSTAGGANITIEGGNITVQCPGKITIKAGKKSFIGPANQSYPLPALPTSTLKELTEFKLSIKNLPGPAGVGVAGTAWSIVRMASAVKRVTDPVQMRAASLDPSLRLETYVSGTTGASGEVDLTADQKLLLQKQIQLFPGDVCLVYGMQSIPLVLPAGGNADPLAAQVSRIMQARNYAQRTGEVSAEDEAELRKWAETDYASPVLAKAKSETDC